MLVDVLGYYSYGTELSTFWKDEGSSRSESFDKLFHQEFHQTVRSLLQIQTASIVSKKESEKSS